MHQDNEKENPDYTFELADDENIDETNSVDDFIRELEEKEKDLHITSETTFIELAADFDEGDVPEFIQHELSKDVTKPLRPLEPKSDSTAVKRLEGEVAALQKKIAGFEGERAELYQNAQRRLKDFESYKARNERERSETFQRQLSNLATQMLPALDNLDRALECAGDMATQKESEFAQFFDGIVLVNQQVNEVLAGMGIVPIATVGEQFDPNLHEAVAIEQTDEFAPNTITAELLRGFRIGGHIIRHSMVKVSQQAGPPITETSPTEGPDQELSVNDANDAAETRAFGEFDPDEIATGDLTSGAETAETTADDETECVDFAIERNGEVENSVTGRKNGTSTENLRED